MTLQQHTRRIKRRVPLTEHRNRRTFGNIRESLVRLTYQTSGIPKLVQLQLGKSINELDKAMEMYWNDSTRDPRTTDENPHGDS